MPFCGVAWVGSNPRPQCRANAFSKGHLSAAVPACLNFHRSPAFAGCRSADTRLLRRWKRQKILRSAPHTHHRGGEARQGHWECRSGNFLHYVADGEDATKSRLLVAGARIRCGRMPGIDAGHRTLPQVSKTRVSGRLTLTLAWPRGYSGATTVLPSKYYCSSCRACNTSLPYILNPASASLGELVHVWWDGSASRTRVPHVVAASLVGRRPLHPVSECTVCL